MIDESVVKHWAGYCTLNGSDKVWAAAVTKKHKNGIVVVCWGPREKTLTGNFILFRTLDKALAELSSRVRTKQNQEDKYSKFDWSQSGLKYKLNSLRLQAEKTLSLPDCIYDMYIDQWYREGGPARTTGGQSVQTTKSVATYSTEDKKTGPLQNVGNAFSAAAYKTESKKATPETRRESPSPKSSPMKAEFSQGQLVRHLQFGVGVVLESTMTPNGEMLVINFDRVGKKTIQSKFVARQAL